MEYPPLSLNIDSAHYLVAVSMRSKLSTAHSSTQCHTPRPDIKQLKSAEVAREYAQQLEVALPSDNEVGATTIDNDWSNIRSAKGSTAQAALGVQVPNRGND